ncbi:MAG: Phosphoglycolate phosphatase [Alphaproteobacteria bacterium MarineAlpha4_Bin2]|nr:MAG: Phosphoglycolate phosphatase [Alphaproteobacteria bacterium MarineAlpha4_Bin2]|tara:strand:- start:331 stop:999 length:669 start_codon:yes stop_codon:yes gene_type:complete
MNNDLPILLFDLDGTLVHTAPDLVATLNTILLRNDREPLPLESVVKLVGDGAQALLDRGFRETGAPAENLDALLGDFIEIYSNAATVHSHPFPNVIEVLEGFLETGHRMAVCTNKPQRPSETILRNLGLIDFFDLIVGGDRLAVRKPDSKHLTGTLELMNAVGQSAIMIGDSRNDVASARDAQMPVIVVSYGYTTIPPAELGGDILIDQFSDLPAAVSRLSA